MANGFLERHRSVSRVAFLALLVLLALSCVCLQVTGRIGQIPYPTPAFPIQDLLLDESAFPEGWRADRPFDPEHRIPAEQIARDFHTNGCHPLMVGAGQEVYHFYGGADSASEAYPGEVAYWLSPNWGDWSIPPELSYESRVADQFRIGCYTDEDFHWRRCVALSQYEEYVVRLNVRLDPEHPECVSFTDLEQILIASDERMAEHLGEGDATSSD
jgi:hypothetical protein